MSNTNIPAKHILAKVIPAIEQSEQLTLAAFAPFFAEPEYPIEAISPVFRATVLEIIYDFSDATLLIDQFAYNAVFQDFLVNNLDLNKYGSLQQLLKDRQILWFFLSKAAQLLGPDQSIIADKILKWATTNSPKETYFIDFENSPLKKCRCTISLSEPDGGPPSEKALLNEIRDLFPVEDADDEVTPGALSFDYTDEQGYDFDLEPKAFYSQDRSFYLKLRLAHNYLTLVRRGKWDGWDSFHSYLQPVLNACEKTCQSPYFSAIDLHFSNEFSLSDPLVELKNHFNLFADMAFYSASVPTLPQALSSRHHFTSKYADASDIELTVTFEDCDDLDSINSFYGGPTEIKLDLGVFLNRNVHIGDAAIKINGLKERLYGAFHSIITEKTRALMEAIAN